MSSIPWAALRGEQFLDLVVYLEGFGSGAYEYLDLLEGPAYLFSEPLWRVIISTLTTATGDVARAFDIVSFAVCAVYAYAALRAHRVTAIFLATPLMIDLTLAQVRSALAGAMLLTALLIGNWALWFALFAAAALVHSASLLLFGLFGLSVLLRQAFEKFPRLAMTATVSLSLTAPLLFAVTYSGVLAAVGDRRADTEAAWPGGAFVVSIGLCYLLMLFNLRRLMPHAVTILAFIVCGVFLVLAPFEINMLRLVSLTFPLIIIAACKLPLVERSLLITVLLAMCMYHLALWL